MGLEFESPADHQKQPPPIRVVAAFGICGDSNNPMRRGRAPPATARRSRTFSNETPADHHPGNYHPFGWCRLSKKVAVGADLPGLSSVCGHPGRGVPTGHNSCFLSETPFRQSAAPPEVEPFFPLFLCKYIDTTVFFKRDLEEITICCGLLDLAALL